MGMTTTTTSSPDPSSGSSSSVVCFSELSDRLACDPSNCTWAYGVYTYKFDVTEAQAQAHVRALVDRMIARAARHYAESVLAYRKLSEADRRAHIIRGVSPVSKPIELPFLFGARGHPAQAGGLSARRGSQPAGSPEFSGHGSGGGGAPDNHSLSELSPRASLSASCAADARRRGSLSVQRAARGVNMCTPDAVMTVLAERWPPLPESPEAQARAWYARSDARSTRAGKDVAQRQVSLEATRRSEASSGRRTQHVYSVSTGSDGVVGGHDGGVRAGGPLGFTLRARLVIDVIASRKSLGAAADVSLSAPYLLGQYIYAYVQTRTLAAGHPHSVMAKSPQSQGSVASSGADGSGAEAAAAKDRADWLSEDLDTLTDLVRRHLVITVTTVTISDASNKLAGRDVLFPYRNTASSAATAITRPQGWPATIGADAAMNAAAIDPLLTASPALSLLFPSHAACLPPVQKALLDQSRMVICFPRMAALATHS